MVIEPLNIAGESKRHPWVDGTLELDQDVDVHSRPAYEHAPQDITLALRVVVRDGVRLFLMESIEVNLTDKRLIDKALKKPLDDDLVGEQQLVAKIVFVCHTVQQ